MTHNFITRKNLQETYKMLPRSRSGLRDWVRSYGFPKPYFLNSSAPVWDKAEVDKWLTSRPRNYVDVQTPHQKRAQARRQK